MAGLDRDLWEKALTSLEELHTVANDSEAAGTEETGEKDNGGKSKLFNLKDRHFLGYEKLFMFFTSDTVAIFDWTEYWFCQF